MTAEPDPAPLIPEGLDATLVLLRHGESEWIREGRFQGQAETPLSDTGRRQAALAGARLAAPHASPMLPVPASRPLEIAHSPLARTTETAALVGRGDRRERCRGRRRRARARATRARDPRDRPGRLGGRDPRRDRPPLDRGARRMAAPSRRGVGTGRRVAGPGPGARPARPRRDPRAAGPRLSPGQPRPAAGGRLSRRRARHPPAVVDPRRPRRGVQGRAADAVRHPAQPVLDVLVRPVRDLGRGVPRGARGPAGAQPDRAPGANARRGGPGRGRGEREGRAPSRATSACATAVDRAGTRAAAARPGGGAWPG